MLDIDGDKLTIDRLEIILRTNKELNRIEDIYAISPEAGIFGGDEKADLILLILGGQDQNTTVRSKVRVGKMFLNNGNAKDYNEIVKSVRIQTVENILNTLPKKQRLRLLTYWKGRKKTLN